MGVCEELGLRLGGVGAHFARYDFIWNEWSISQVREGGQHEDRNPIISVTFSEVWFWNKGMRILLSLMLLCAVNVRGQVLIYKRTIHSTVMGNGFNFKRTVVGYLILVASTGTAAEFDIDSRAKEFLSRSKTLTVAVVHGGGQKDHMVFAEVLSGTDNLGPYKASLTARGISASIDVGLADNRPAARAMRVIGRDVYFLVTEPFINEQAGSLVLDLAATRGANSAGQTLDDIVTKIRSDLIEKGYRDAHP